MLSIFHLKLSYLVISQYLVEATNCGKNLFTDNSGTIKSPNFGKWGNEMTSIRCTYQIAVKAKWVELVFNNLFDVDSNMPDCYSNYVEVSIGSGASAKTLSRFCSLNAGKPHDIYARDGCIKITYSENSSGKLGFSATYTSYPRTQPKSTTQCAADRGEYFRTNQGLIVSPGWPYVYTIIYPTPYL